MESIAYNKLKRKEDVEVEKLLLDLIKIPSESEEEKDIGEFIVSRLKENFEIKTQVVNQQNGNFNILAYTGIPKVLLNAHLDTVPGQIKVSEDDKSIYGRGACDTKTSIASMIIAAEELLKKGENNFGLLFNVCEETDFSGIKKALEIIPESVEYVVIGEPTNLDLIYGQKGILVFQLISRGKSAHGSTPEFGENAIEKIIEIIRKLKNIKFQTSEELGENVINVAKISGGIADNVVPDYAEVQVAMRCVEDPKFIIKKIKEKLENLEIVVTMSYEPSVSSFAKDFSKTINVNSRTVSYFTEMYFLSKKTKCFILGPGDGKYAHSEKEQVEKKQLREAVEKYLKIITLLNKKSLTKSSKKLK